MQVSTKKINSYNGNNKKKKTDWLFNVLGFAIAILLWEFVSKGLGSVYFPEASKVACNTFQLILTGNYWGHILSSMQIVVIGFFVAVVFGFIVGITISLSRVLRLLAMPIVDSVRGISALSMFPLIIIILGLGIESRILVIFWTAWPAVALSTINGLANVNKDIVEAGQLFGMNNFQVLFYLKIPLASQELMTGAKIGLSGGWISLVAAEMLGSSRGLGYFVLQSANTFHYPDIYSTIIVIAVLGLGMNIGMSKLQRSIKKKIS
jgi:NitT/TauT family transport system permease protein